MPAPDGYRVPLEVFEPPAPRAAVESVTRRLRNHPVEWYEIRSDALGARADHTSRARQPELAARAIARWIADQSSR